MRDAVRDAGLVVAAIGSGAVAMTTGLTLLNEDAEKGARAQARLVELINFAHGVAAPIVTIGSLRGRLGRQGSPFMRIWCRSCREWRRLLQYAMSGWRSSR